MFVFFIQAPTMTLQSNLKIIHIAALSGSIDAAKYLLSQGINVDDVDNVLFSIATNDNSQGRLRCIMRLLRMKQKWCNISWMKVLISTHKPLYYYSDFQNELSSITQTRQGGETALMKAIENGSKEVVEELLSRGCDISISNNV